MAGGGFSEGTLKRAHLYEHKITGFLIFSCIIGATGGALFGYDLGVSGGVTSMDDFLKEFFPHVYERKHAHLAETDYCKYDDQMLTLFTSSLYFAALVSTFGASSLTKNKGRKASILAGSISFFIGALLNAAAKNISMLIIGRILLGVGIGFGNQAVPLYLSEMAPAKIRGAVNQLFQFTTCLGILIANLVNYGTERIHPWGWRLSLGLATVPATLMFIGGCVCPETPNSLVEQGRIEEGRTVLEKVRGTPNIEAEFDDLLEASRESKSIKNPFKSLLLKKNRPQLIIGALAIPAFQQLTGNNSILFYAPVIFQTLGFGSAASLYSSVITSIALLVAAVISMAFVDKFGRRAFLLEAGIEMILCMIATAIVLALGFGTGKQLSFGVSVFLVIVIFLFVLAYGRSWGPLGWLVPSELFPLEIRSAAQSVVVCVNMVFTALVAQFFLVSLCNLKYGIFLVFAALIVFMTCFVFFLLPETKQVPIEEIYLLFEKHWFWKRVVGEKNLESETRVKMAGGGYSGGTPKRAHLYEHKITGFLIFSCIVGATGGALFGYDLGVSGGVTSMDDFLMEFFPHVYERKHAHLVETDYCKYDDQMLTLFTSSLYFAALVSTFGASSLTKNKGRKASILVGSISFFIGALLNAAAKNISMLIIGRILLGVGIGFGNQAVPLYLSEMAPAKIRGAVNQLFQFTTCLGILIANLVNYGTERIHPWGWRLSLGLATVPATLMFIGGCVCPETPNSLVEQCKVEEGRIVLEKVRGTPNVDAEFDDLLEASRESKSIKNPFKSLLLKKNRPQLIIGALAIPAFQQLTGNNSILFYAPVIFQTLGFGSAASLYSSVITSIALLLASFISMAFVDKFGRRAFFLEAGIEMILCMIATAIVLALGFGTGKQLSFGVSVFLVIVIFLFVLAYGRSWGPLGWLVPSELFPLEIRSAAQSVVVCVNMVFTALVAQFFLVSLCNLKYGIFLVFAALIVFMTCFVFFLLPETKQVPIEEIYLLFEKHWFWKRVVGEKNLESETPV
ncbi:hypothetical protein RJT34_29511 [Clitoria ternatea]|uniref:Major facilitator superfamily (MFS) profile domain-containing protein n=1 Tax=Clitoria ternatea TaxID=43366 RepID=A0AAN9FEC4_CLITE